MKRTGGRDARRLLPAALLAAALLAAAWLAAWPVALGGEPRPRPRVPASTLWIDRDGDGFGVACPRGPDADDADPAVNTAESALKRHGDWRRLLEHLGYRPAIAHFVSPDGDDRTARDNDIDRPYATLDAAYRQLRPGSAVVIRAGTYAADYVLVCANLMGTAEAPIVFLAMPGERAVLKSATSCLEVRYSRHLAFDGLVLQGAKGAGQGIRMHNAQHIAFRNIESLNHARGMVAMQDLHEVTVEGCVFHDNGGSHGVYLGSRDQPNSRLVVRNNLIYRNAMHGFQHNGRATGLLVEANVIHSNGYGGVSLLEGVSDSAVRGNVIFNNNKQGIVFYAYDSPPGTGILPFDQDRNVVERNVVWVGRHSWQAGAPEPRDHCAVQFHDATAAQRVRMAGNVIRDNVLVTFQGPVFLFNQRRLADATAIEGNLIFRAAGPEGTMACEKAQLGPEAMESFSALIRDNTFADPGFRDVSVHYCRTPERFDFSRGGER